MLRTGRQFLMRNDEISRMVRTGNIIFKNFKMLRTVAQFSSQFPDAPHKSAIFDSRMNFLASSRNLENGNFFTTVN